MIYDLPAAASTLAPAALPPRGLDGLDPAFSRLVTVPATADGEPARTWHLLDNADRLEALDVTPVGTILCVHGNPTWSYLWRKLVTAATEQAAAGGQAWRVVAVDQLDMGFSERTGVQRGLPQRVRDLGELTAHLGLTPGASDGASDGASGPVATLGHDWGGVVSAGWALDHPDQLHALMLLNTAVHQPEADPIPAPLRLALRPAVLGAATVRTPGFLETTLALAHPPLPRAVKDGFRAPYTDAARRGGIGGFVADIPVDAAHPSSAELDRIAKGLTSLDVPALMLWGPRDPIFSDRYLDDLVGRLPHADVHRFEGAGHLVAEDVDYASTVLTWLDRHSPTAQAEPAGERAAAERPVAEPHGAASTASASQWSPDLQPMWSYLDALASSPDTALVEMAPATGTAPRTVSWRLLFRRVTEIAAGLSAAGVRHGDRVSMLVQPGADLTAVLYACLRIGAVVVVADAGLGVRGLTRAVRGAWPDHVIGQLPGLTAARALGWPGQKISTVDLSPVARRALGVTHTLREIVELGTGAALPEAPRPGDTAAILFTSGSTGPAKGVVYTHAQLCAVRDVLAAQYDVGVGTALVAGFAPFALLGPALGTRSVTPDMDVTAPRTLTARGVAAAVAAADATVVFLSPAAITNVVATADDLTEADRAALAGVRTFLSAGAPIAEDLLRAVGQLMPGATGHTPYGMTEALLLTDITAEGIADARTLSEAAGRSLGVCVGAPTGPARVLISALDADGHASGVPSDAPGVTGEVVVSAPHLKDHYDRLWLTNAASVRGTAADPGERWHRTGDVGHLDDAGRLWIEGRLAHVVVTATGVVTPVGIEQDIESLPEVARAAAVGVGPVGVQQLVAVVETTPPARRVQRASSELAAAVRAVSHEPVAAVLVVPTLPTDVRHNSKIDRAYLSGWAADALSGGRLHRPTSATRRLP